MANRRLVLEPLEDRRVPATFGIPWADPSRLTLSFARDGTAIAGRASDLFASLNADRSPAEWQPTILRAFYLWAAETNLDVAVVPDDGSAFGTPGRLQGDPRFGDIRIGGNRLSPEVLAVASPPDPALAGTLAGDVFVNTNYRFKDTPYDLLAVMLHEAGHALGLDHSTDPLSPMYPRSNNTRTSLTAGDVQSIRTLYGPRNPDRFEGTRGNESIATASAIPVPTGYAGATPLLAFGDLRTAADADVFWFDTVPGRDDDEENVTVRVQSAGLSLLAAKVTVYYLDADGRPQEVANVKSDSADYAGDTLTVTFDGNDDDDDPTRRYFIRIEDADDAPFRTGRYALAVTFDGVSTVPAANVDRVVLGPYGSLGADALAALLRDPTGALVNADGGANESIARATPLGPTSTFNGASRHEVLASLASATDADVYRVTAPAGGTSRTLTAVAWALPSQAARPGVEVLNAAGARVPAEILVNDNGTYTVQAVGLTPGATYFLRVKGLPGGGARGNYFLTADFGKAATQVRQFASGRLAPGATRTDMLYIGQAQLFHLVLSADAAGVPAGTSVHLSVIDEWGREVLSLSAAAGETISKPAVLLRPGAYRIRYRVTAPSGSTAPITFRVRGDRISDPTGPVVDDPTLAPEYGDPNRPGVYRYPGPFVTTDSFYWRV